MQPGKAATCVCTVLLCLTAARALIAEPAKKRTVFWRRALDPYRKGVTPHRAVRDGSWKYIDLPSGERYLFDLADWLTRGTGGCGSRQNRLA